MAATKLISYENLSKYDELIKGVIQAGDAQSIKSLSYDSTTRVVSFFKTEDGSGTAAYTITLPATSDFVTKLTTGSFETGDFLVASAEGGLASGGSTIGANKIVYAAGTGGASDIMLPTYLGAIPNTADATNLVDYAEEVAGAAVDALDGSAAIASKSGNVVTLKAGISQEDGAIANSSDSDIVLAAVASTGSAGDVSYTNTTSGLTATDVQSAIDEVVDGLGTAAAADIATTAIAEGSTDTSLVSSAQVATFVASEIADLEGAMHFVGVITRQSGETDAQAIARVVTNPESGDVVVMSDNAKEYVYDGTAWREVGDEGLYVQKSTTIAGVNLEDNITKTELLTALNVEDGAEVNIVESVQVNSSALTPDANRAVNITIAEGATDGTIAVNGTDVAVHGLGSAAYTDSSAYDAAGTAQGLVDALTADDIVYEAGASAAENKSVKDALDNLYDAIGSGGSVDDKISTAIEALDADLDASGTAQHSGVFVVSGVTEVDGVLTAVDSVEVEPAGTTATAIAALDSSTGGAGVTNTAAAEGALDVLASVTITDGLITAKTTKTLGGAAEKAANYYMVAADYAVAQESDITSLFSTT